MSDTTEPLLGQNLDSLENKPKGQWGGPRPNSGRPKGSMNLASKERMAIRKAFEDRIHTHADNLLTAALNKALGESFLFVKITERNDEGKIVKTYTEIVTDPEVIRQYLDGELDHEDDEYYYISTKPVDMVAVKELYDRAFGKSLQRNELTGKDGEPLAATPEQADQLLRLRALRESNS